MGQESLSVVSAKAETDISRDITRVMQGYKLPAFFMAAILSKCLVELNRQATMEVVADAAAAAAAQQASVAEPSEESGAQADDTN